VPTNPIGRLAFYIINELSIIARSLPRMVTGFRIILNPRKEKEWICPWIQAAGHHTFIIKP